MYDFIKKLIDTLLDKNKKGFKHTAASGYLLWTDDKEAIKLSIPVLVIFSAILQ